MENFMDTLVTIGIVLLGIIMSIRKNKKKMQAQAAKRKQQQTAVEDATEEAPIPRDESPFSPFPNFEPEMKDSEDTFVSSLEEIVQKNPKTEDYFTYERVEPEIEQPINKSETCFVDNVDNNVQNIENEEEKNPKLTFEMSEIYKGVIYSEILKRPYN